MIYQSQHSYIVANERPKRNRCPSQYASYITQLKQETNKNNKHVKDQTSISQDFQEKQLDKKSIITKNLKSPLICQLPNGRKIQLQIILTQNGVKHTKVSTPINQKPKQQTIKSLLDLFQSALFNVQIISEQKPKLDIQSSKQYQKIISLPKKKEHISEYGKNNELHKKQVKKDAVSDQQKTIKIYEKFKSLDQRLKQFKQEMVFL